MMRRSDMSKTPTRAAVWWSVAAVSLMGMAYWGVARQLGKNRASEDEHLRRQDAGTLTEAASPKPPEA
jgi:tellurite resistance protein TehA-like permease